jgi:hypothetical protein
MKIIDRKILDLYYGLDLGGLKGEIERMREKWQGELERISCGEKG